MMFLLKVRKSFELNSLIFVFISRHAYDLFAEFQVGIKLSARIISLLLLDNTLDLRYLFDQSFDLEHSKLLLILSMDDSC